MSECSTGWGVESRRDLGGVALARRLEVRVGRLVAWCLRPAVGFIAVAKLLTGSDSVS